LRRRPPRRLAAEDGLPGAADVGFRAAGDAAGAEGVRVVRGRGRVGHLFPFGGPDRDVTLHRVQRPTEGKPTMSRSLLLATLAIALLPGLSRAGDADTYPVGVAAVDVTPSYPIRLHGFGFRRAESEGVRQHVFAKALAVGDGKDAVVVITTD